MSVGAKIKELRLKAGLTQKALADSLYVTYQAVSKWENEDTEPSLDTLKQMCKVLNCSIDEFFDNGEKTIEDSCFGYCENCGKKITEETDYNVIENSENSYCLCNECKQSKDRLIKDGQDQENHIHNEKIKQRRLLASIIPPSIFVCFYLISFFFFLNRYRVEGFVFLGIGIVLFCNISTVILHNTFITKLWFDAVEDIKQRFKRLHHYDNVDSKFWLVVIKIIFFIALVPFELIMFILTSIICFVCGTVLYPVALHKNLKGN